MVTYVTHIVGRVPNSPDRPGGEVVAVVLSCPTLTVEVWSLGATLVEVALHSPNAGTPLTARLPDVSAYDDPDRNHFVGSTMGRWGRVVSDPSIDLDGSVYELGRDRRGSHRHGGPAGFHTQLWKLTVHTDDSGGCSAVLTLTSPDGHQGYPGEVEASVTYRLDDDGTLTVEYQAITSATTLLGLVNHVYWRVGEAALEDLELLVPAQRRLRFVGETPSADSPVPVEGGPFDFRQLRTIGSRPLDTFFVFDGARTACQLACPARGITLHLTTTASGVGVYTGDHDPVPRRGICLEFGGWPGAERRPDFPSPLLRSGQTYQESWQVRVVGP